MTKHRFEVLIAEPAAMDIADILAWSLAEFGEAAAGRYEALIAQALIDLAEDPLRPGAKERTELLPDAVYLPCCL